ncbi:MAG: permease [Planctomycetes bacterium]|nr:permease [Planctomycetota bacterium]
MNVLVDIAVSIGAMLEEAGVYVIGGFLAAGLVYVLVSRDWMTRHLGGGRYTSVLKAALVGVPLPLCSCSVLPTAYALRRKGAGRGATISFLISTPETGVDSIAVTWALMGPVMAVVRPLAACVTAVTAGLLESLRGEGGGEPLAEAVACELCHSDTCEHAAVPSRWGRFWRFVLFEMGDDVGPSLALGLVLAGLVAALMGDDIFTVYLADPWLSMAVMLVVGLPLYVCATASTPLAAALVLKGLNPGAALVFLLVGPATNLATVLTVGRMLGKASAAMYVGTIAVVAIGCGAALNALAGALALDVTAGATAEVLPEPVRVAGGVVLGVYLAWSVGRWVWRRWPRADAKAACGSACEHDDGHGQKS